LAHQLLAAPTVNSAARPADAQASLYVSELGRSGPRLILLHGLFGQGKNWATVARALSSDFRVVLVDLPNHGRSDWTEGFSYPEMAEAVRATVAEPGRDPMYVVGHSMGGKVAMVLSLLHPALVSRLVVSDVAPVAYSGSRSFGRYVAGMRALDLDGLSGRAAADSALANAVPDPMIRGFLLQNLRRDSTVPAGWRWQLNLPLLGDHLADVGDWPDVTADPYLGPVLWLAGANSDYITKANAPAMRRLFPRAQLVTVKNSGHWVHAEQPEIFVQTIRRFLHPD
jgi:esterase